MPLSLREAIRLKCDLPKRVTSMNAQTYTLAELAKAIDADLRGDANCQIHGIASISNAQSGEIAFLTSPRYRKYLPITRASAVLLPEEFAEHCKVNTLISPNPELGVVKLLELLIPKAATSAAGIHPTAVIGKDCQIDPTVTIGPHVVIGDKVIIGAGSKIDAATIIGERSTIGKNCRFYGHVTVYHDSVISDRVFIHSGAVIGADGFGLAQDEKKHWVKIPQVGRVVIGNDVEIGANTTIDRGALEDTLIGNGVKMDNQIMVGHNVHVGDHTVIAGCAGIAGSARIGRHCVIGPAACLKGHIEIADNTVVTGMAMVHKSLRKPGVYSSGTGIQLNHEWHKSAVYFWQLEEFAKRLKRLERLHDEQNGN